MLFPNQVVFVPKHNQTLSIVFETVICSKFWRNMQKNPVNCSIRSEYVSYISCSGSYILEQFGIWMTIKQHLKLQYVGYKGEIIVKVNFWHLLMSNMNNMFICPLSTIVHSLYILMMH